MKGYKYSARTGGFYHHSIHADFPDGLLIHIEDEYYAELMANQVLGRPIVQDAKGYPISAPITIEEIVSAKNAELKAAYHAECVAPIECKGAAWSGIFQADEHSQSKIAHYAVVVAIKDFFWLDIENNRISMDNTNVLNIAILNRKLLLFTKYQDLKAAVRHISKLGKIDDIVGVSWTN
jgi:hypothetical protein